MKLLLGYGWRFGDLFTVFLAGCRKNDGDVVCEYLSHFGRRLRHGYNGSIVSGFIHF